MRRCRCQRTRRPYLRMAWRTALFSFSGSVSNQNKALLDQGSIRGCVEEREHLSGTPHVPVKYLLCNPLAPLPHAVATFCIAESRHPKTPTGCLNRLGPTRTNAVRVPTQVPSCLINGDSLTAVVLMSLIRESMRYLPLTSRLHHSSLCKRVVNVSSRSCN